MNRGSQVRSRASMLVGGASMRPRFMNRGSFGSSRRPAYRPPRFNEAPIHESGKSARHRLPDRTHRSFNEAPIHESGKLYIDWANIFDVIIASMRPRFMNRGSAREGGAGSHRGTASMRPRFMNRGSAVAAHKEGIRMVASMRPRFMNRGSGSDLHSREPRPDSFNEAPIHESGKSQERERLKDLLTQLQ